MWPLLPDAPLMLRTGIASVASPNNMIRIPAPSRFLLMNADSFDALSPVNTIAGIVPKPNAIITRPPLAGSAVVAASSSAL
jgi:hypothetical protein